ncbi:MAG: MFS transporter [Rhodomicrobiaceae bacterium]
MSIQPAKPTDEMQKKRFMVPAFALATAAIVTTEFIVIGLLPLLAGDFGVTLGQAAWLVSTFAISAAVAGPAVTLVAGRWPPRAFLTLSAILFGLCNLIAAIFPSFTVLLVMRAIQGSLLTPFVSIASASAAAGAGERRAGQAIGQVNMGTVIGVVVVVPAMVSLAEMAGWQAAHAVLGAFTILAAAMVAANTPGGQMTSPATFVQQADILRRPDFLGHLLLSTLLFTAMFAAYSYIAAYLETIIGLSGPDVAFALFGFGVTGIGGNWLASRVVDRDPTGLTVVVALIIALTTAGLSIVTTHWIIATLIMGLWGAAHMAAFVACQVRVMFAGRDAPAFAGALNISVCNLGIAAGAIWGGWFISWFGLAMIGWASAMVGLAALATAWMLWRLSPRLHLSRAASKNAYCPSG